MGERRTLEAPAADAVESARPATCSSSTHNATNRRVLEEMLLGWRMVPTLAASVPDSARRAAQRAEIRNGPSDLVLTDFLMPDADGFTLAEAIKKDPAIAGATVVMLTSVGQAGDAARCRELGIAAYLPKPIKRSDLRARYPVGVGRQVCGRRSAGAGHAPFACGKRAPSGRFLLVEDNSVNQLVARRLLEKRGHTVVVANNGREALASLDEAASVGFGCVLMDIQMPEMDGFECTAIIRDKEKLTGSHLPIIGMTALCDEAGRGTLPGGGDGRVSIEADSTGRVLRAH